MNAGTGSLREMLQWLSTHRVLYGLVRMSFGTGIFRRSKWVYLQWAGVGMSAMARGRLTYG
eukprot:SAG31_NODE_46710_length_253_cov_0.675325_1_plen_60_part_10